MDRIKEYPIQYYEEGEWPDVTVRQFAEALFALQQKRGHRMKLELEPYRPDEVQHGELMYRDERYNWHCYIASYSTRSIYDLYQMMIEDVKKEE